MNFKVSTLIILHILLGLIFLFFKAGTVIYCYLVFFYFAYQTYKTSNKNNIASLGVIYISTFDTIMRINYTTGSSYEFSKYCIIILCIMVFILNKKPLIYPKVFVIFLIALLPSFLMIDFTSGGSEVRKNVISDMTGPFVLALSAILFSNISVNTNQLKEYYRLFVYPLIVLLVLIIGKLPTLASTDFNFSANNNFSAGFGSNQISTQLGFGIFLILSSIIIKQPVFKNKIFSFAFVILSLVFALLTFSRGGVIVSLLSSMIVFLYYATLIRNFKQIFSILQILIISSVLMFFLWNYVNQITDNKLQGRYEKAFNNKKKKSIEGEENVTSKVDLSGRESILMVDFKIFLQYPIAGVGPGMSYKYRKKYLGMEIGAHTEYTRLLCDHGLFGFLCLLILLIYPLQYFYLPNSHLTKLVFIGFVFFSLLTMFHSATRIAITVTSFGFAFIKVKEDKYTLIKQDI